MKNLNNFFTGLIVGLIFTICIAATNATENLFVVKPAMPKFIATKCLDSNDAPNYIYSMIKDGYQVKNVSQGSSGRCIVIMEKY